MKATVTCKFATLCMAAALMTSCMESDVYNPDRIEEEQKQNEQEIQQEIAASFDYNLTAEYPVTLNYQRKALVEIYDKNPLDQREGVATKLYAAFTDDNGNYRGTMVLPKSYVGKTLYARSNNIGVTYLMSGTLTNAGLNISPATSRVVAQEKQTGFEKLSAAIESELPEEKDNSAKLGKENDINLKISKDCHIDVTFVWSGAGCWWGTGHWDPCAREGEHFVSNDFDCNLYYFTYTADNIPTQKEIEENFINDDYLVVGYANQVTSKSLQGTTVRLTMPNGSDEIPAGTRIGWVITHPKYTFINQWDATALQETIPYIYSIPSLNQDGSSQSIRYQYGTDDEKVLLYGMEDLPITQGIKIWGEDWNDHAQHHSEENKGDAFFYLYSDNDYNDVLFTIKADPMDAILEDDTPVMPEVPVVVTTSEEVDKGTLLFEDMFPQQGDYDMNDVVIEYVLTKTFDNDNELITLSYEFTPVWDGADYISGFSFMIDGHDDILVDVFDNHKEALHKTFTGTVNISGDKDDLTWDKFNPFIRVKNTNREVHLSKKDSSPKADLDGLDDYQKAYVNTVAEYPFAMKIPVLNYSVVTERVSIDQEYPQYKTWVDSKGTQATDWYLYKN